MSVTIEMPKLSDTMSVGTVVKWHKSVGDKVANGDTLAEIETDKATMELENFEDGILLKILVEEGEEAPIGSPLAFVGEEGEEIIAPETKDVNPPEPAERAAEASDLENVGGDIEEVDSSSAPIPQPEETVTGNDSTELSKDLSEQTTAPADSRIRISPLAKKIASERNLDISAIKGSGPSGRIVKKDVLGSDASNHKTEATQPQRKQPELPQTPSLAHTSMQNGLLEAKTMPLSGMRSVIAKRLSESKSTIPHFYLQREINIKPLLETRLALNENAEKQSKLSGSGFNKLSVNDLILKACAESIKWHPEINTSWGESELFFMIQSNLLLGLRLREDCSLRSFAMQILFP